MVLSIAKAVMSKLRRPGTGVEEVDHQVMISSRLPGALNLRTMPHSGGLAGLTASAHQREPKKVRSWRV